jgi:hypothetical protein
VEATLDKLVATHFGLGAIAQSIEVPFVFGRQDTPRKVPASGESPEGRSRFNALVKMLFVILAEDRR